MNSGTCNVIMGPWNVNRKAWDVIIGPRNVNRDRAMLLWDRAM